MAGSRTGPPDRPFRRRVFYIPGYDPFPPRRYRELYRRESARQARLSGYRLAVAAAGRQGWRVEAEIEGRPVEASVEVLVWSDLVQASMRQGIAATYGQLLRTAWTYLRDGTLLRLARLRRGPAIAALYPFLVLIGELALALAVAAGGGWLASKVAGPAGWLVAVPLLWVVLRIARRADGRIYAWYLIHDYAYGARDRGAYPPELAERLGVWRDRVAAALDTDADEVLVVGHSTGAHLAVSVLAGLPRVAPGRSLGLLTLGQVVPMIAFLPGAARLRGDLARLAGRDDLTWVDVTAPGDGCAYALCDPVAVSGVAPADQRWPLLVSAAFSQTMGEAEWRRLRRRWFRLHFQYLCAFERPGAYDYFRITAGPQTLAERFAGVAPSPGRIRRPANPYRDVA